MGDSVPNEIARQGSAKFYTWFISVRPQDGISDRRINLLKNWIVNQPVSYMVTEGIGAQRHAHIAVAFSAPRVRSNVINAVLNLKGMDFTAEEAKAFRSRNYKGRPNPCIWYSWKVIEEYLCKDTWVRVWHNSLPPKSDWEEWGLAFFPAPDDKRAERGSTTNAEWRRYKKMYHELDLPPGVKQSEKWFIGWFNRLMNQDEMRLIVDQKILRDKVRRFMDYVYEEDRDDYIGSISKKLKTMEQEDDHYWQIDKVVNKHLYMDKSERRQFEDLDQFLTRPH